MEALSNVVDVSGRREREPHLRAMSEEEIFSCTDEKLLRERRHKYLDSIIELEIKLKFPGPPGAEMQSWYSKVRNALIAYCTAVSRIDRHIKQMKNEQERRLRLEKEALDGAP